MNRKIWLWAPIVIYLIPHAFYLVDPALQTSVVYSELGIVENLTVFILLLAVLTGILAIRRCTEHPIGWFRWYLALFTLGCFYFKGEEISWGQTYFRWSTPEQWQGLNDQQETNLHNIGGLFDQTPRALLSLAAFVGGICAPAFVHARRVTLQRRSWWYWILPTYELVPTAILATIVVWPRKIGKALDIAFWDSFMENVGELKECLLALFLLLYLSSIAGRMNTRES